MRKPIGGARPRPRSAHFTFLMKGRQALSWCQGECPTARFEISLLFPRSRRANSDFRASWRAVGAMAATSAEAFHVEQHQQPLSPSKRQAPSSRGLDQPCSRKPAGPRYLPNVPRGTLSVAAKPRSTGPPPLPCAYPSPSGAVRFPLAPLEAESPVQRDPAKAAAQRWQPPPNHRQ